MTWLTTSSLRSASDGCVRGGPGGRLPFAETIPRHLFRLSFHFGLFQFLCRLSAVRGSQMSTISGTSITGWRSAARVHRSKMIYESLHTDADCAPERDPTRKWSLVALSWATSIDASRSG